MNKFLLILLTLVLFSLVIIGCAGKYKSNNTLTGTIYVSGNEPFTHLALKGEDDNFYKIECPDSLRKELWKLQGNKVQLDVVELKEYEKLNTATVSGYTIKNDK